MKGKSSNDNVHGSWRGYYAYADGGGNVGFEAVFLENKGAVEGSILDEGKLGEARAFGSFSSPNLTFTKVYQSARLAPVKYQGTLSDGGKLLSGTWRITKEVFGTWVARRYEESEELKFEERVLEDAPAKKHSTLPAHKV